MKTRYLNQETFDQLLDWLDPDRNSAGEKYESIRARLIIYFTHHRCSDPEGLADETINRVASRVGDLVNEYTGDPILYFYGVAKNVNLECARGRARSASLPSSLAAVHDYQEEIKAEQLHACLEQCLHQLPLQQRKLLLAYYGEEGSSRKTLTKQLGIQYNALRVRIYRTKAQMQKCLQHCLEQKESE